MNVMNAERLATRGYDLILVARDGARLQQLVTRLTDETGRSMTSVVADLNTRADRIGGRFRRSLDIPRRHRAITSPFIRRRNREASIVSGFRLAMSACRHQKHTKESHDRQNSNARF
jgi:hypothetical protein